MTSRPFSDDEDPMPPLFFPIASDDAPALDALDALALDALALDPPRIVRVVARYAPRSTTKTDETIIGTATR